MSILESIKQPVAREMERYEDYIKESLHSDNQMATMMVDYIFSSRGKAIRPLLAFLSAGLHNQGREFSDSTYLTAMLVEMMHTASLVHDDVIDEANIRRGKPSAKALWRSHRAVLIGDYILAKSFTVGMNSGEFEIVRRISNTMSNLIEGELIQSEQSDKLEMTREIYFDIIFKKTASLIGISAAMGALSAGASEDKVEAMGHFGNCLGMAFQIKDDIFDYTLSAQTGKPACGDLKERKITLPLLTVLEKATAEEHSLLKGLLADVREKPENADILCEEVVARGGLQMAIQTMNCYIDEAKKLLGNYPDSPYKDSLLLLCDYVAERDK